MPETLFVRDFSAGWCPSDDAINGRPNALLQMDNMELDRNGALQLTGGTQRLYGYSASAHTMFSRYIDNVRCDYAACIDGSVWRNGNEIITGGDNSNAAFSTAFNFTLICSGSRRFKDDGYVLDNLGILPPTQAPTVTQSEYNAPWQLIGEMRDRVVIPNGYYTVIGLDYTQCITDANGIFIMQTYPPNSPPFDCTTLVGPAGAGTSTQDDVVIINGYMYNPFGVSFQFDVMLEPGDSLGDVVTDYYTYVISDLAQQATFDTITGAFTIRIPRSSFNVVGSGARDWSTVYGFRITINTNQPSTGSVVINLWGMYMGQAYFTIKGGTGAQNGTYRYAQVNVNNTGSYIAKSILGPISNPITLELNTALITVQNPTSVDHQCNEAWIYRTGGNLGGSWYRVLVVRAPFTTPVYDNMGDQAALDLDLTIDINLVSIGSVTITDKIMDIIGPIQGRWYYFTQNFMYPSDVGDPDLVNASLAVRLCGSSSELFMWARPVSASVVIVGTSIDCYLMTGTFSTFPDGTIDIYYQSLGVKFPPISYDAVAYGGAVYYMAADGWRTVLPTSFGTTYSSQNNQLLVAPNLDRIYNGEICYGYGPPNRPQQPGSIRYPVTIVRNKLWCFPTGTGRGEVYDFVRNYWRTFNYNLGDAAACVSTQDNKILVNYINDRFTREVDTANNKLIDGATWQTFRLLFTYKDNGKPRQRKDSYTFKSRCLTSMGFIVVTITDEYNLHYQMPIGLAVPGASPAETFIDISQPLGTNYPKSYMVELTGILDNVIIEDWSIDYDSRPIPLTFLRIYPTNLGSAAQKRVRTWPFIIDTLNNYVTFTPNVDNINQPSTIFNSNYKKTLFHYFKTDVFGIDYGGTLYVQQPGEMEVWDTGVGAGGSGLVPDVVQTLPEPTEFDQVGPLEIFRWGKILRMALRCYSSGSPIPFKVYLSDQDMWNGQFNVIPGVEDEYIVDLPKGVSGRILRVELGPCGFTFNKYFMKFQVAISGGQKDTELQWITIPGITSQLSGGI